MEELFCNLFNSSLIGCLTSIGETGYLFEQLARLGKPFPSKHILLTLIRSGRVKARDLCDFILASLYPFFWPATIDVCREDTGYMGILGIVETLADLREYGELLRAEAAIKEYLEFYERHFGPPSVYTSYQVSCPFNQCANLIEAISRVIPHDT